jgi:tripartite-type tricarboxylate transporter receptor subunit TctC
MKRIGLGLVAFALLAAFAGQTSAQQYPTRPVKILVTIPPGGAPDIAARLLAQRLTETMGGSFFVENRPGANGNVAADNTAKAEPDGYTLILAADSLITINPHVYPSLPYDPLKDLLPVSSVASNQFFLAVNPALPVKTLPELIEYAKKANPPLAYASGGNGSQHQLGIEMLKQRAGINMLHVPYRGGAPALQDILAGQVDSLWDNIPGPLAHVKTGRLRPLAVTSLEPSPVAPDVPPMSKFYPGFQITSWGGLCGPAGMPPAMVERAAALTKKALESDALKKVFLSQGATPFWLDPAGTVNFRRSEEKQLAPIIKASGAKVG